MPAGRSVFSPRGAGRVARWREEAPQRGAAWLAMVAGVPLVPVAMQGNQGTLAMVQTAFRRSAIRVWVEEPLDPLDFVDHVDPIGALGEAWLAVVGDRLDPWWDGANPEDRLKLMPW